MTPPLAPAVNERAIFADALDIADPADRASFLDQACAGDPDLRQRLDSLIGEVDHLGSFLDQPALVRNGTVAPPMAGERLGDTVGPFKLLEKIGEGGMGDVYMAEQTSPVRRRVALKIVKPGLDTDQVVARFEAERQALALMDHPNIARVLDAGATSGGRPYFVMELVRGLPITDYCDQARLGVRDRLALFVQVCSAVQHAHQKGVIHRDLKPSNVLVTVIDGRPVSKVIDFGVAKATEQKLTDRTLFTGFHQLLGTPLYMSPEQAELSGVDVDTRTDVYALGVLLYELLTGTTPFDPAALRTAAFDEVRRIIREEEPARPSRRLSTLAAERQTTVSEQRGVDGRRLDRLLRGELDWVVMRALEKDRNRRYESAGALAADVERYLADEPVSAGPPSAWYRARKYARRHRRLLATGGVIVAALVAATAMSSWLAVKARDAQRHAETERDRATAAEQQANAISDFLQWDLLRQVNSDIQREAGFAAAANLTVKEALDRAAAKIGDRFREQPLVEAALRRTIGLAYRSGLGDERVVAMHLERAVELYRTNLGPDDPETLVCERDLASTYQFTGRLPDAIALFERILDRQRAVLGPDHFATLGTLNSLGEAYRKAGQYDRALRLIEEALERKTATLGPDHPATVNSIHDLGLVLRDMGRYPEAIIRLKEAAAKLEGRYGPDHSDAIYARDNLIEVYERAGQFDDAIRLLRFSIGRPVNGTNADRTRPGAWRMRLGKDLLKKRAPAEAESVLREGLAIFDKVAPRHWQRFETMSLLGESLTDQQQYAAAEPLLLEANALMQASEADHVSETVERIVRFYEVTNQPEKAREWREKLAGDKRPDDPRP